MMNSTTSFATQAHVKLYDSCFRDDWSFDNTFLFMGSGQVDYRSFGHKFENVYICFTSKNSTYILFKVATTIGYGHITPKSKLGKTCCVGFTLFSGKFLSQRKLLKLFSVPLFAILLQFISLYIDEQLTRLVISVRISNFHGFCFS